MADFWEKFPRGYIDNFVSLLPGHKILDLGSGPGRDALLLRSSGLDVVCLDGSEKMVQTTRNLGFESILSDIRDLSVPKNSFDGIWAYSSIIHISFDEAIMVMRKASSILREGGILFLGLIRGSGGQFVQIGESSLKRYYEYYSETKVQALLKDTGLEFVSMDEFQPGNHVYMNYMFRRK